MRPLAAFVALGSGVLFGVYAYAPEWVGPPAMQAFTAAHHDAEASSSETSRAIRIFSPQSPLYAQATAPQPVRAAQGPSAASASGAVRVVADTTVIDQKPGVPVVRPVSDWTTTVTPAGNTTRLSSSKPGSPEARAELARNIQRELKRVGCYEGEIDGSWGGASKRAIGDFVERVNATLPTDEPDYILLTLVQGHRDIACGQGCPSGQAANADGKCLPKAILASNAKRAVKPLDGATDPNQPATASTDGPPSPASQIAAVPAPRLAQRPSVVATAETAPAPVQTVSPVKSVAPPARKQAAAPVATPPKAPEPARVLTPPAAEQVARAPAEPLPGRMAIGGPVAPEPVPPAPLTADKPALSTSSVAPSASPAESRQPARKAAAHRAAESAAPRRARAHPNTYAASSYSASSSSAARQRAMIYNLFQRPDRY